MKLLQHAIRAIALTAVIMSIGTTTASDQLRRDATAGNSMTDMHFKQQLVTVKKTPGFAAGIIGEMIFPGVGFGLDIGAQYQMLGAKANLGEKLMWNSQGYGNQRFYMHTLSIPVHLRFKYTRLNGFEEYLAPLIYVGPSFDFLLGHSKCEAFSFPFGSIGIAMGIGAEIFRKWQVTASFNLGMTYVTKADILTDYSAQNRVWKLSVAYFFGRD